jgi:hypothetical protein
VTHDPAVARSAKRIVALRDGWIVRDEPLENPYLEDLREFKALALGQALLEGRIPQEVQELELRTLLPGMQLVLSRV